MEKLLFKSYEDLVSDIRNNIHLISKYDFDIVVGIPRSGMIPAYLISAYLNVDCCDVDSLINNNKLQKGITRNTKSNLQFPQEAKKILLIDDSIYSGESLKVTLDKIPEELLDRIKTAAIYATSSGKSKVDFYLMALEGKKIFEWGIYHNNIIGKTCFDLDGVLCSDCLPEENDDDVKYLNFIKNAPPKFIPTKEIHSIVTNRLEKYRNETENWLKRHGVKYQQLIMLDLPNKQARIKIDAGIDHKGHYYKSNKDTELFIESSLNQSISISRASGKPVYCADENRFIHPNFTNQLFSNSNGLVRIKYYKLKHALKPYLGWIIGK